MRWVFGVQTVDGGGLYNEVGGLGHQGDGDGEIEWDDEDASDTKEPWGKNASVADFIAWKNMQNPASSNNSALDSRR